MKSSRHHITICVCTYKRPRLLERLLNKLEAQKTDDRFSFSVVVVDNDDRQSGRNPVGRAKQKSILDVEYHVESQRSISLARNRSVQNARGDLIAFIDDDEFPDDYWLSTHLTTLLETGADGVLGPVKPHFEAGGPIWLIRSGLLDRKTFKTTEVIPDWGQTRTGNVLIWRRIFDDPDAAFDVKYGKIGGGDAVFFKRMMEKGKVFVWCNEATVYETVLPERQTRAYYLKRACTRGLGDALATNFFHRNTLRSLVAIPLYTFSLPFLLLFGQHLFMRYLVKDCDHLSRILGYMGIKLVRERPYKTTASA
jgi:glycosyltransferase involved in cell wall biosynthesis